MPPASNPFDTPSYHHQPHDDPFMNPSETPHPASYQGQPPTAERYPSPNMVQHNPSPQPVNYPGVHYHPDAVSAQSSATRPLDIPQYSGYQLADRSPIHTREDLGDMPLLQRGPSSYSDQSATGAPGFPGGYAGGYEPGMQDDPDNNIRYGRIPQRVPRRYKTIKKVE